MHHDLPCLNPFSREAGLVGGLLYQTVKLHPYIKDTDSPDLTLNLTHPRKLDICYLKFEIVARFLYPGVSPFRFVVATETVSLENAGASLINYISDIQQIARECHGGDESRSKY